MSFLDGAPEDWILPAAHSLLPYGGYLFVSSFPEENCNRTREILVDLEEHQPSLL